MLICIDDTPWQVSLHSESAIACDKRWINYENIHQMWKGFGIKESNFNLFFAKFGVISRCLFNGILCKEK